MSLTAKLGTRKATPGNLQPGYFATGTAVWAGPFPVPELEVGGARITTIAGQASIALTVASQMDRSDLTWWVFH
jgi:hypothetical protein